MINWTRLTQDPLDSKIREEVHKYLLSIRAPLPHNDYNVFLAQTVNDKEVLDIGICEHTVERMNSPYWKHNIIRENAKSTLGIDILEDLVGELNSKGYNVITCDATSSRDLGKKFDIIHAGDVIEHVNSPVDFLHFCKRHLKEQGKVIIRTPNAYNFNYISLFKKQGTDLGNMEHMFYILPIHMMEISRRANMRLTRYLTLERSGLSLNTLRRCFEYIFKNGSFRHVLAELFAKPETYTTIYVYEIMHSEEQIPN